MYYTLMKFIDDHNWIKMIQKHLLWIPHCFLYFLGFVLNRRYITRTFVGYP